MPDFFADAEAAWMQGKAFPAPPTTWYLGLISRDGKEVSGGGYQRMEIAASAAALPLRGRGEVRNAARIESVVATADWGHITLAVVFSVRTGGAPIVAARLEHPGPIFRGQRFVLDPGKLRLLFGAPAVSPGSIL